MKTRNKLAIILSQTLMSLLFLGASVHAATIAVPLPDDIKSKGKLIVGTYCDYAPFGFTGADQKPQGTDPDLARHLAQLAFGSPDAVEFQCVKSDQRISFLQSKRIDLLISTLGVTIDRAKVIAFSEPYFASTTLFMARKGEEFKTLSDLDGQRLAVAGGTPWITWLQKCQPRIDVVQFDGKGQIQALSTGRVKAVLSDSTWVFPVTEKNPNFIVTGPSVDQQGYQWAIGLRQEDKPLLKWVNAALDTLQQDDAYWKDLEKWVPNEKTREGLQSVVRRPNHTPDYSVFQASVVADPACPN